MLDILAERGLDGYPGTTVRLETSHDMRKLLVTVNEVIIYKGSDKRKASNAYFHPFVYGYDYPIVEEIEVESLA